MNANLKRLVATGMFSMAIAAPLPVVADATEGKGARTHLTEDQREQLQEAKDTLKSAVATAERMITAGDMDADLANVKGMFIVPNYARAAVGVGGSGGEGVLFVRENGDWTSENWGQPMFYNVGAISAGAQVGIEAGEIVMLLMTENAVDTFMQQNNFSLNADAGLTLFDFSERAQAAAGKGDIVIWSDTEGAFADLAINVENVFWEEDENDAYYGQQVKPDMVLMGDVDSGMESPLNGIVN